MQVPSPCFWVAHLTAATADIEAKEVLIIIIWGNRISFTEDAVCWDPLKVHVAYTGWGISKVGHTPWCYRNLLPAEVNHQKNRFTMLLRRLLDLMDFIHLLVSPRLPSSFFCSSTLFFRLTFFFSKDRGMARENLQSGYRSQIQDKRSKKSSWNKAKGRAGEGHKEG
jgi:hypothetical protein